MPVSRHDLSGKFYKRDLEVNSVESVKGKYNSALDQLVSPYYNAPFSLLLVLLVFGSFRPDRLLPGGSITVYFPTLLIIILLCYWLGAKKKILGNSQTKYYILMIR